MTMRSQIYEPRFLRTLARQAWCASVLAACGAVAHAQISIGSAVDLAVRNSPRVKMSEAEVLKARAALAETKDSFIPAVNAGAAIGQAYGYSPYPPTLFTLNAGSLIYNASQFSYIHSARSGLDAAQQALQDVRESVAEDAALAFVALEKDQQREAVLAQQAGFAHGLLLIVEDRLDAGLDSRMDLTNARLTVANTRLANLRNTEDSANDRAHLARLMGVPETSLRAEGGFPAGPVGPELRSTTNGYANSSVAAAFATARARQLQAHGDATFLYRPQISFVGQYNRYATFTNSFQNLEKQYRDPVTGKTISANEYVFGVQINIPLLDRFRRSKALETAADATRALHEAEFAQLNVLDAQSRLSHSIELLQTQAEIAGLEQQRAQDQLEELQLRLKSTPVGPAPSPRDEQNSRIAEREKYIAVIEVTFQLHQAEISLLRQTGHLEDWLVHASLSATPDASSPRQSNP